MISAPPPGSPRWLNLGLVCLVACNNPPGPATIALSPADPLTTDDLDVVFLSESTDGNRKDTVSYNAFWFVDGVSRSDLSGMTVGAEETAKGEIWKIIITPTDGELDGPPVASEGVVGNSLPEVEVSVDKAVPLSNEDVTETATGTDVNRDALEFVYTWTVEGDTERAGEGATLSAFETVKGEVGTVAAVAKDESDPATQGVSIENVAPVVESVSIDPAEPRLASLRWNRRDRHAYLGEVARCRAKAPKCSTYPSDVGVRSCW